MNIREAIRELEKDPRVEYAEPVPIDYPLAVPNDSLYHLQTHLRQIFAEEAWDIHKGEEGEEEVVIGICDTGVEWYHPDLIDNIRHNLGEDADGDGTVLEWDGNRWIFDPGDENELDDDFNGYVDDFIGWNFSVESDIKENDPDDGGTHGTHVAGIASAVANNDIGVAGIAWNVKILPTSHAIELRDIGEIQLQYGFDGIIYLAENEADIINCSFGSNDYSRANREAIEYATALGSIIVASAGNDNTFLYNYPAAFPGVISVASINEDDQKVGFSNYGVSVDISAPGQSILSTFPGGYSGLSGTSMSSPLVAGLLGLMKSYYTGWSNEQLIQQLLFSADKIDTLNPDYVHHLGSGRINALRALTETNPQVTEVLKFGFDRHVNPSGNWKYLNSGEPEALTFGLRNFNHFELPNPVTFTLTTEDPDIEIIQNTYTTILNADSDHQIENAFDIRVREGADYHFASFQISVHSDIPVVTDSDWIFQLEVAGSSGIHVYEFIEDGWDYSGKFIKDFLTGQGLKVTYSTSDHFPETLTGYDAVFISCGNIGSSDYDSIIQPFIKRSVIEDYLRQDGRLYIEGSSLFSDYIDEYPTTKWLSLLGLFFAQSDRDSSTSINSLVGQKNSIFDGLKFFKDKQITTKGIDRLTPNRYGTTAFRESDYGIVSVQNEGSENQKTVCFSYGLSSLMDVDSRNNRYEVLSRILNFFEIPTSPAFAFDADVKAGQAPFKTQFRELYCTDTESDIVLRRWDFNNDGVVDSEAENPIWTYNEPGIYTVSVEFSDDSNSVELIQENLIQVFETASALYFDESDTSKRPYVFVPNAPHLNLDTTFTLEAWIKPTAWVFGKSRVIEKDACLKMTLLESMFYPDSGRLMIQLGHPTGETYDPVMYSIFSTHENTVSLNSWQHIAFTYDRTADEAKVYINGFEQDWSSELSRGGPLIDNMEKSLYIGNSGDPKLPAPFHGFMDDVRVWDIVRSGIEIRDHLDQCLEGDELGLVGYWPMNDASGIWVHDDSKWGHNAMNFHAEWSEGVPFGNSSGAKHHDDMPLSFRLYPNYPNPFNPVTTIPLDIPKTSRVLIHIYDILGRNVKTLSNQEYPAGNHLFRFDASSLASGIYFIFAEITPADLSEKSVVFKQKLMFLK